MFVNNVLIVLLILAIVFLLATIVADWIIFEKAGESGWKSLIPFYNSYIYFKISWKSSMFWITFACSVCYAFFSENGNLSDLIGILAQLAATIMIAIQRYKLGEAFDRGAGFCIGMALLGPIFSCILAFGDAEYKGIRE